MARDGKDSRRRSHSKLVFAAVSQFLTPADGTGDRSSSQENFASYGALAALRPLHAPAAVMRSGIPWAPTPAPIARFCDSYLALCGQLFRLLRLAGLKRRGPASTSVPEPETIAIETTWGLPELANLEVIRAVRGSNQDHVEEAGLARERAALTARMKSYMETDHQLLIRYDNDLEIVNSYRKEAQRYGRRFLKGRPLPPEELG
jgi:hypothetical protein